MRAKKGIANKLETRDESGSKAVTLRLSVLNTNLEIGKFAYLLQHSTAHSFGPWLALVENRCV